MVKGENSKEVIIRLKDVVIGYNRRPLLSPISLEIRKGEFWGIVGPNGAGKTTLLKTILGILKPVRGEVELLLSQDKKRHKFGYVPQRHQLDLAFPLTAYQVVAMGRYGLVGIGRGLKVRDREKVFQVMERLGIKEVAQKLYRELSGGQQQRVLIARALSGEPQILLLDEPTSGMDLPGEKSIMELLRSLNEEGITILLVSHLLNSVADYVDHIAYINKDKDLFKAGVIDEILNNETLFELYGTEMELLTIDGTHLIRVKGRSN